jgi:hypothetical protein
MARLPLIRWRVNPPLMPSSSPQPVGTEPVPNDSIPFFDVCQFEAAFAGRATHQFLPQSFALAKHTNR